MSKTRLFVGNLPPKATEDALKKEFSAYGVVSDVDIKEKQNANNSSNKFAFVTLEIDTDLIHQCIQEFREMPFHGHYLTVSVAKESFLEKLKREREEAAYAEESKKRPKIEEKQEESEEFVVRKNIHAHEMKQNIVEDDEETFLVKKRGQGAQIVNGKLKIFGDPGYSLSVSGQSAQEESEQKDPKALESEKKRLESLNQKKDAYKQKKFMIKAALSNSSAECGKRTIFEDKPKSTNLFENDDYDDDNVDFSVRQQFQGDSGQKLLNLQTKFKGDKRFALSEDFKEDNVGEDVNQSMDEFEDERKKQLEILESVVGRSLTSSKPKQIFQTIQRYDPTKKGHEKFLKKDEEIVSKKESVTMQEPPVQVSSEKFYSINMEKIAGGMGSTGEGFSLLKMMGRDEDEILPPEEDNTYAVKTPDRKISSGKTFKYDSSDDESNTGKKKASSKAPTVMTNGKISGKKNKRGLFTESFFIQAGDLRLQDGAAFFHGLEMAGEEFQEKRQQLKQIVRTKIRKNQLKTKRFVQKKRFNGKSKK
ncbi:hypothetical protein DMENIID0001_064900 [Sergentomyia squamirostris]